MSADVRVPTVSARKNIFLDFLSPENHVLYGTESNLGPREVVRLLSESLNVAVLLSGDYCLSPPFFALQSDSVRQVLWLKSDFLTEGAVRIPIREASLTDYFGKKITEYEAVKDQYPGLFDRRGQQFVERFAPAIIKRHASVGRLIAARWQAGPDESRVWRPLVDELAPSELESVRIVPTLMKESGEAVTWLGMQRRLPTEIRRVQFEVNQALQHDYTLTYLEEYNATILTAAPPKTTDLLVGASSDLSYDYWAFRGVLTALGLWEQIRAMRASYILQLKFGTGFLDFLSLFELVCKSAASRLSIRHYFARLYRELQRIQPGQIREIFDLRRLTSPKQAFRAVRIIDEALFELVLVEHSTRDSLGGYELFRGKNSPEPETERDMMPPKEDKNDFTVFVSYAHVDNDHPDRNRRWLDRLLEQLQPLVMQNQVIAWSDTDIEIGDDWHGSIQSKLQHAKVAVLLISPSFLASKYIRNSELPVLLMNAKKKGVTILPIIVRHCLLSEVKFKYPDPLCGPEELSLSIFQTANPPDKPLNSMEEHEQDRVLLSIAQRILKLVPQRP